MSGRQHARAAGPIPSYADRILIRQVPIWLAVSAFIINGLRRNEVSNAHWRELMLRKRSGLSRSSAHEGRTTSYRAAYG